MIPTEIKSHEKFLRKMSKEGKTFLLLYKSGSEASSCALINYKEALKDLEDINAFTADVSQVRDIHPVYSITSAPVMLIFTDRKLVNTIKGCSDKQFFMNYFQNAVFEAKKDENPQKSVVVYSTPTCSWCNTLKGYLNKHHIRYRDVDVSRDQHAAEALVRRSGQQGVPQTEIEGRFVVGFDKQKINTLLGINR